MDNLTLNNANLDTNTSVPHNPRRPYSDTDYEDRQWIAQNTITMGYLVADLNVRDFVLQPNR